MKTNMKKLLVIVMALMPSLSIFAMNPSGFDLMPEPDDIPIIPHPGTGGPGPRIMSVGPNDIPITPDPNVGGGGGPRQDIDPNLIPIKPVPGPGTGHEPRIRSVVQEPECYHFDGVVYIEADNSITYINATVTRYDDNLVWSNASNTNTLSITASADSGTYLLELTLSDGRSFIGEYIIE